ncbi:bowman-birk serine protease inhibitor family protein, putative (macronuclear) [Tetrahymena thermophila SB210]|uniref:Bowman-birk serine protease inhibitor family protein, putative n=1 Tax=Tetrahymena thermophila (strain SB210) TaxID=312017 RepID=Q23WR1_TETTS|nr:bowman-birk serine protease inhibitor family protein, putative [Tetrahymena thermophila SB210]EAS00919.2 bowman-birk serine protease inhibitor family protein, putative [Tetrahymena thermophila SB210]|eukprot:XP_001021164.2 bowman-birk serine protease inhibitor family protein, putative [Tetrahymena thermophila SB210]
MKVFIKYLIISTLSFVSYCQSNSCDQVLLQSSLNFYDCQLFQQNSLLPSGNNILKSFRNTVQKVRINGWFNLLGQNQQKYVLIEIKNLGLNVFQLLYDQQLSKFQVNIFSSSQLFSNQQDSSQQALNQSWFYLDIGLNLADQAGKIFIYYIVWSNYNINGQQKLIYSKLLPSNIIYFDNTSFEVFVAQTTTIGYSFGCALIKQVAAYINQALSSSDNLGNLNFQDLSLNAQINFNINFSIQPNTGDYLLNLVDQNQKIKIQKNKLTEEFNSLHSGESFEIGPVNMFVKDGIILAFDLKVVESASIVPSNNFLNIKIEDKGLLNDYYSVQLQRDSNNPNQFNYLEKNQNFPSGNNAFTIQSNTWIKIILFFHIQFGSIYRYLYINQQYLSDVQQLSLPSNGNLYFQFQNIYQASQQKILFRSIKIYQGTKVFQCGNCLIQSQLNGSDCLVCQSNFKLLYSESSYCIAFNNPCPNGFSDLDLNNSCIRNDQAVCNNNNQYKFYDNTCRCIAGQYYKQGNCFKCPSYCLDCQDENTCKQFKDSVRNQQTNVCPSAYFDDGSICILRNSQFNLPNKYNFMLKPPKLDTGCNDIFATPDWDSYLVQNDALQISKQSSSFIFGIRFIIYKTDKSAGKTFTLGFLRTSNYNGDVFFLMAQQGPTTGFGYIQIYFLNKLYISIPCVIGQPMWLSFVTDLNYLIVQTVTSLQPIQTYRLYLQNQILDNLQNPKFWYGVGMSKFISSDYSMCSFLYPYTLIIQIQNIMSLKDQDVFEFNNEGIVTFYSYNFSQQNSKNQQNIKEFFFGSDNKLSFTNLPFICDQVKGISITNSNQGQYFFDITKLHFFFFMCSIYINQIQHNIPLFQVIYDQSNLNQMLLSYRILYSSTENKAHLEVCVVPTCQVLYNTIRINEPNFIVIRHENQAENWRINIPYTQILVIINYQKKLLQFASTYPSGLDFSKITAYSNLSSKSENEEVLYFLNNIKIFSGGYLYMDYSDNNDCFLFVNRTNFGCLVPKLGYALQDNQIIPSTSCTLQPLSNSNTQFYYNPLTFKCEDSFNYFENCINIDYSNINSCNKCIDPNMIIINGNCKCQSGMFWNTKQRKCQICSQMCLECQDTNTNCTICRNIQGTPPLCQCPQLNQYLDSKFQCQQCQAKCSSCQYSSDNCLVCSVNRLLKTQCQCDLKYFKFQIDVNQPCQEIDCAFQCIGCTYFEENCKLCRGNRINAPICNCPENYYEENPRKENCLSCPSHTYYDQKQNQCLQCDESCLECRGGTQTDCKKCAFGLILTSNNECKCPQGQSPSKNKNQQIICYSYFNLEFGISLKRIFYLIEIKFEQQIEGIIDNAIFVNNINIILSEVPVELYSYTFYSFDPLKSILKIQLIVNKSFQAIYGYLIFKTNKPFKNDSNKAILNPIYTKQPLFFEIGPYLFILDETNKQAVIKMGDSIDQIEGGDQNLLDFARNIQFLFYLLNSLQPIAMFLLVNAKLPQNFYTFLQLFSTFIFKRVPDYQVKEQVYNFTLLGNQISKQDYIGPGNQVFIQLAFSDALLVNTIFILAKYVLLFLTYMILKMVQTFYFQEKYNYFYYKPEVTAEKVQIIQNKPIIQLMKQPHSNKVMQELKPEYIPESLNKNAQIKKQQLFKAEQFLIYRMLQENEINLLMVVFCVSIQFNKTDQSIWLSRWSFYLALIYLAIYITFFINYVRILNGKDEYLIKLFTKEYDERLTQKRNDYVFIRKNYHALGMLKKVILVVSIYFLVNFPMIISILGITLNSFSLIFSLKVMPFKKMYHNIIKIIGDSILITLWCLMIYFIRFELDHKRQIEIPQDEVDRFIFVGNVASIVVFILNILYLTQFIYDNIIYQIWSFFNKRKICISKKNQQQQRSLKKQPQKQQKEAQNKVSLPQIQLIDDKKYQIQIKNVSPIHINKQVSSTKSKKQSRNLDQLVLL